MIYVCAATPTSVISRSRSVDASSCVLSVIFKALPVVPTIEMFNAFPVVIAVLIFNAFPVVRAEADRSNAFAVVNELKVKSTASFVVSVETKLNVSAAEPRLIVSAPLPSPILIVRAKSESPIVMERLAVVVSILTSPLAALNVAVPDPPALIETEPSSVESAIVPVDPTFTSNPADPGPVAP